MTDREMLELAAKAAGMTILDFVPDHLRDGKEMVHVQSYLGGNFYVEWSPLHDDGDALRLAVKLGICVEFSECADNAPVVYAGPAYERRDWPMHPCFPDPCKETRRAIVRAAAEIGRSMP